MAFRNSTFNSRLVAILLAAFALTESMSSVAQTNTAGETVAPSYIALLKEGTAVKLKLRSKLSSRTSIEGDPVNFVLDQDVKVGDITVAKAGSTAVGTISHANKAGMLGRPGDLGLSLEYLKTDDSTVRLRGAEGKQGRGKEGAAVALTVLFGPIGLIKHGRNAEFKEGTQLVAYVDQDVELPARD